VRTAAGRAATAFCGNSSPLNALANGCRLAWKTRRGATCLVAISRGGAVFTGFCGFRELMTEGRMTSSGAGHLARDGQRGARGTRAFRAWAVAGAAGRRLRGAALRLPSATLSCYSLFWLRVSPALYSSLLTRGCARLLGFALLAGLTAMYLLRAGDGGRIRGSGRFGRGSPSCLRGDRSLYPCAPVYLLRL